jgi:hypothetical protein
MKRKGTGRDLGKERFWRGIIGRQRRSGQSVRGFCREHALSEPSFYAWRREIERRRAAKDIGTNYGRAQRPAFVSVELAPAATIGAGQVVECLLPSGAVLRLSADMTPAAIADMVLAWERGRC